VGHPFDTDFLRRLNRLREGLLPHLKGRVLLAESPTGREFSPEPESPRSYAPGDDIRTIDWNLFARLDRLFHKTMVREEELTIALFIDTSASMTVPSPAKFTAALQLAAALADIHLALGHRVTAVPWADRPGLPFGPFSGQTEFDTLARSLSLLRPEGNSNIRRCLAETVGRTLRGGFQAFLISDFLFPATWGHDIAGLAVASHRVAAFQILTREERAFRLWGNFVLIDPETGEERKTAAGWNASAAWRKAFDGHLAGVESMVKGAGGTFSRMAPEEPFEETVRRHFSRQGASR
jgi:uncharacterized protein (DUF58 family)